ncbi:hypothetical protein D4S03_03135 [bacterium]|nr:MAG: hypothetical protein D4S03_03135 [bacterium]
MGSEPEGEITDKFSAAADWSDHFDKSIRTESTRAKVVLSVCYPDELLRWLVEMLLKPVAENDDPLLDGLEAPLKHIVQTIPSACPRYGSEMEHRAKIKAARPGEHG